MFFIPSPRVRVPARLVLGLLVSLAAMAGPVAAKDIRISGAGTRSCAEWQSWKEQQRGEPRALALEWAQGFISGHNVYARIGNEPANSVVADSRTLATLLDNFCQKYPQGRLLNGVIEITKSLGGAGVNLAPKAPGGQPAPGKPKPEREA